MVTGFVNQARRGLARPVRYTALGVSLPDRLAYSGTYEKLPLIPSVSPVGGKAGPQTRRQKLVENRQLQAGKAGEFLDVEGGAGVGVDETQLFIRPRYEIRIV